MANDRNRMDEQHGDFTGERMNEGEDTMRNGIGEDVRGVAEEEDDEFEDMDDLEDDEEGDESV